MEQEKKAKKRSATAFSKAVAAVIRGRYKKLGLNQEELAQRSGLAYPTLRRMIAGESEISSRDLAVLAGALGTSPQSILDEALNDIGGIGALMSEVASTTGAQVIEFESPSKKKARSMTIEEIEEQASAATRDPQMDTDEPDAP